MRLFSEQWLELPGRQLAQINNLHGPGPRPLASGVRAHFYHIIEMRPPMHFGNIRQIGGPWLAAICVTIRLPGEICSSPADLPAGVELRSLPANPSAWVSSPKFATPRPGTPISP